MTLAGRGRTCGKGAFLCAEPASVCSERRESWMDCRELWIERRESCMDRREPCNDRLDANGGGDAGSSWASIEFVSIRPRHAVVVQPTGTLSTREDGEQSFACTYACKTCLTTQVMAGDAHHQIAAP